MNNTDFKLYKAFLEHLKQGLTLSKSSLARYADIDRKTIRNRIEQYTFQNIDNIKN